MSGLDDLMGGLTKQGSGGRIEDLLGGLLGGSGGGRSGGGGLDDLLGGMLGGGASGGAGARSGGMNTGALVAALAPLVIGLLKSGGLQKLIQGFQQKGMSSKADSWVSTGDNERVSGSDMKVGLGEDEVHQFAQQAGISDDQAADVLAAVVPSVVDGLTPDGRLPSDAELERLLRQVEPASA